MINNFDGNTRNMNHMYHNPGLFSLSMPNLLSPFTDWGGQKDIDRKLRAVLV